MITYRRFLSLQVGAIMLTHELNNYTMSEAIKWYPSLRAAFNVNFSNLFLFKNTDLLVRTVRRPSWSVVEQDSAVRREHAYSTVILTMSVTFLNTTKVLKCKFFFTDSDIASMGPAPSVGPVSFAANSVTTSEAGPAPSINATQGAKSGTSSPASRIQISGSAAIVFAVFIGALIGH